MFCVMLIFLSGDKIRGLIFLRRLSTSDRLFCNYLKLAGRKSAVHFYLDFGLWIGNTDSCDALF